jgi:hypothetical protein
MPLKSTLERFKAAWSDLSEPEFVKMFADMYWHALILASAFAIVCSLGYAAYRFMNVEETLAASVPAAKSASGKDIDRTLLQNTVDSYKSRAAHFLLYASSTDTTADPAK